MPRIPYIPEATRGPIVDAISSRRGNEGLLELDRILLHAPALAQGWNSLMGAIRTGSSLPDEIREMIILRVAILNSASYEWLQHEPVARKAGVSTEQLDEIRDIQIAINLKSKLSKLQQTLLSLTDQMTREIRVKGETFEELQKYLEEDLDPKQVYQYIVEAVLTCASYNMVSRFLVAMDVGDCTDTPCPIPKLQSK